MGRRFDETSPSLPMKSRPAQVYRAKASQGWVGVDRTKRRMNYNPPIWGKMKLQTQKGKFLSKTQTGDHDGDKEAGERTLHLTRRV